MANWKGWWHEDQTSSRRALPLISPDEDAIVGLPDTIWFPDTALRVLPNGVFSFLRFPVEHPEFFDTVVADERGRGLEIQVKQHDAASSHSRMCAAKLCSISAATRDFIPLR